MREHAAAVDVADEQRRRLRVARDAHVGDVAGAQIRLGGAACPLGDDEVEPGAQRVERLGGVGPEVALAVDEVAAAQ